MNGMKLQFVCRRRLHDMPGFPLYINDGGWRGFSLGMCTNNLKIKSNKIKFANKFRLYFFYSHFISLIKLYLVLFLVYYFLLFMLIGSGKNPLLEILPFLTSLLCASYTVWHARRLARQNTFFLKKLASAYVLFFSVGRATSSH